MDKRTDGLKDIQPQIDVVARMLNGLRSSLKNNVASAEKIT